MRWSLLKKEELSPNDKWKNVQTGFSASAKKLKLRNAEILTVINAACVPSGSQQV